MDPLLLEDFPDVVYPLPRGKPRIISKYPSKFLYPDYVGPYFILEEEHGFGQWYRGFSNGGSKFYELPMNRAISGRHQFTVSKRRSPAQITVSVHNADLADLLSPFGLHLDVQCDILPVLKHCYAIQELLESKYCSRCESRGHRWMCRHQSYSDIESIVGLEMFVHCFLLDQAIFSGITCESDFLASSITFSLWQLRQQRKALNDLADLDESLDFNNLQPEPENLELVPPNKRNDQIQRICRMRNQFGKTYGLLRKLKSNMTSEMVGQEPSAFDLGNRFVLRQFGTSQSEFLRFVILPSMKHSWKNAVGVIRQILRGRMPGTVEDVICCIMAADAMRIESRSNTLLEFLEDLDIWRDVVQDSDKSIFDLLIFYLWDKYPSEHLQGKKDPCIPATSEVNLYFQRLFQKLLSGTGVEYLSIGSPGGERLSVIQSRYAEENHSSSNSDISNDAGRRTVSGPLDRHSMIDKGKSNPPNPPNPMIFVLAATVIFSAVIAIILILFHPIENDRATSILQGQQFQGSDPLSALKRNCILLACYLGLSTLEIENYRCRFKPADKIPCETCGKEIRAANMARHTKIHNIMVRTQGCPDCGYKPNRSDNLKTHRAKYCPGRKTGRRVMKDVRGAKPVVVEDGNFGSPLGNDILGGNVVAAADSFVRSERPDFPSDGLDGVGHVGYVG